MFFNNDQRWVMSNCDNLESTSMWDPFTSSSSSSSPMNFQMNLRHRFMYTFWFSSIENLKIISSNKYSNTGSCTRGQRSASAKRSAGGPLSTELGRTSTSHSHVLAETQVWFDVEFDDIKYDHDDINYNEFDDINYDHEDENLIWQLHQHLGLHWPQPPSKKKCHWVTIKTTKIRSVE